MVGQPVFSLGNLPEYRLGDFIQGGEIWTIDPVYDTGFKMSVESTAPYFDWTPWLIFLGIAAIVLLSDKKK